MSATYCLCLDEESSCHNSYRAALAEARRVLETRKLRSVDGPPIRRAPAPGFCRIVGEEILEAYGGGSVKIYRARRGETLDP